MVIIMKKFIAGLFAALILTAGVQVLAYGCEGGVCELPQSDTDGAYWYDNDDDGSYCWGNDGSYCGDDDGGYCRDDDDDDTYCYGDRTCGRGGWHRR